MLISQNGITEEPTLVVIKSGEFVAEG